MMRAGFAPSLVGSVAWVAALELLPAPFAARIFLLAPVVIVPRLLALLPDRPLIARLAGWPALIAAAPLVISFGLPSGVPAALLALPWIAVAGSAAFVALNHALKSLPAFSRLHDVPELGLDVALGFWAVGAAFVLVDRLAIPTPFPAVIVLLTATHFHFAGLGLLGVASLLARSRAWLRGPVLGLVVGIPLTALGFVLASNGVNSLGALCVGLSGIGVGVALLSAKTHGPRRLALGLAGAALLVSMPLAIAWSLAILSGQAFLDLDTMIRTHGELNAVAVLLAVVAAPVSAR